MVFEKSAQGAHSTEFVDYYEALGLNRDDPQELILEKIKELKLGWSARAARSGSTGETAAKKVEIINQAELIFSEEKSRREYDQELAQRETAGERNSIAWLERAWNYYFTGDEGAASVAARKARQQDPENPMAYVISSYACIMVDEYKQAKQFADEAFVLDDFGSDTTDVHVARGRAFYFLGQFDRSVQSLDRALKNATYMEKPIIHTYRGMSLKSLQKYSEAVKSFELGFQNIFLFSDNGKDVLFNYFINVIALYVARSGKGKGHDSGEKEVAAAKNIKLRLCKFEVHDPAQKKFLKVLDTYIKSLEELARLARRHRYLENIKNPGSDQPRVALIALALAVVAFVIGLNVPLLFVACFFFLTWFGYSLYRFFEWKKKGAAHSSATQEIQRIMARERYIIKSISKYYRGPLEAPVDVFNFGTKKRIPKE